MGARMSLAPLCSAAVALALFAPGRGAYAETLRCSNTTSGAQWTLPVDLTKNTVDGFPAEITNRRFSWEDTVLRRYYDFNRSNGRLTLHVSSSTGGFYRIDRCVLK